MLISCLGITIRSAIRIERSAELPMSLLDMNRAVQKFGFNTTLEDICRKACGSTGRP